VGDGASKGVGHALPGPGASFFPLSFHFLSLSLRSGSLTHLPQTEPVWCSFDEIVSDSLAKDMRNTTFESARVLLDYDVLSRARAVTALSRSKACSFLNTWQASGSLI
jgi:hypothetical protein